MNSNTLRIRGSENKNTRVNITFDEVILPDNYKCDNELCTKFITSNAEGQLTILKQILYTVKDNCDHDIVHFLVVTYLSADSKHPAKCMITRYVTKNNYFQNQFSDILTHELEVLINKQHSGPKSYSDLVCKVGSCTENFPAGADAVKNLEIKLAQYFTDCLTCCIATLSDTQPLSPTAKNEIFNVAHSTLRLLLYLVQRVNDENTAKLISMFSQIRASLKSLIFDGDSPMDTKSVCGILYVYMHLMENGADSWVDILDTTKNACAVTDMLENDSARLSLYSAIVTVIPMSKLQIKIANAPACVLLTHNILDIGDRSSAESTLILGVTRTLVQICKGLDHSHATGLLLLDGLFVFVWSHLEHYTDSVQHLTAQALGYIIKYCARLKREGNEEAMNKLFATLTSLDRSRKSFYVSLSYLTNELGAGCVMDKWPRIVHELLSALSIQAVQASATTTLETLLRAHVRRSSGDVIHERWVQPIVAHVASHELNSAQLNILENLLSLAAKLDQDIMSHILPHVKEECSRGAARLYGDVKCVLMLLGVARRAGALPGPAAAPPEGGRWRGIIGYDVLEMAAVDASQEIRILSISLIVESPKSTETFAKGELDIVLWFIKYNINAQTPNFRQLVLSAMKKFIKRFESSYKVLSRENGANAGPNEGQTNYLRFVTDLRALCFDSLLKGANYSRRHVALQILVWLENVQLDGHYDRVWTEVQVEALLYHLSDSYDINKALALELLTRCPEELLKLKQYSTSLELQDILSEASSVKPTDCVSAVHKLKLLRSKLPAHIVPGTDSTIPSKVKFALLGILLKEAQKQLAVCQQSIVYGARNAPMYGILHCIGHALEPIAPFGIPADSLTAVMQTLVDTCVQVCACAGSVLASAAPEGLLPDVAPQNATCDSAGGYIRLEDGREVTAQMVLLCAWRSVKEVSLILSTVASQVLLHDELRPASLRLGLVRSIGEQFTALLTETKHRGAFEQVYVGFTRLLTSLWRSPSAEFHELPARWLAGLLAAIEAPSAARPSAARRSAGLPFLVQALVITELQVKANARSFDSCMNALLRVAREAACEQSRCHGLNVLRALFRNSQLDDYVGAHVGAGLLVALMGFESGTWIERNSATLLFSALMVRIFGVQRSKDSENLSVRNRMTGRIFFLRYPQLYDFMLHKLKEVSESGKEQLLHPSLYPILLLLARLYPSSLEGTVSNLKLSAFVSPVVRCAGAATLHTRRLAANAVSPLVPPDAYIPHVESMLNLLCDESIKRNFCHGILLQILKLLDTPPENLPIDRETQRRLASLFRKSVWILTQCSGNTPCYVIADEYIKIINVLIRRFDTLLEETFINEIQNYLNDLIFNNGKLEKNPGKELCLSNATYLYIITLNIYNKVDEICQFVRKCLSHHVNEVVLAVLNYLLILYGKLDIENPFQQHLNEISHKNTIKLHKLNSKHELSEKNGVKPLKEDSESLPSELIVLDVLRKDAKYIEILCEVLKCSKYLECTQKCLRLITLEPDTQINIINAKENKDIVKSKTELSATDDIILDTLIRYIENEHENLTHIYLASLSDFLSRRIKEKNFMSMRILDALRLIFACSLSDNCCDTRSVVVEFLEENLQLLREFDLGKLSEEDQFEFKATLWATVVTILEDEDESIRARSSHIISRLSSSQSHHVIASRAMDFLLGIVRNDTKHSVALLTAIALLDFKAEVCMNDDINDECRVFDQNERYNADLEETIWARACAAAVATPTAHARAHVHAVVHSAAYRSTFERLCGDHITAYTSLIEGRRNVPEINPKIEIFYYNLGVPQT